MAKAKRRVSKTAKKSTRAVSSRPRSSSSKKAPRKVERAFERARRLKALAKERLSPAAAKRQRAALRQLRHGQRSEAAERGWETRRRKARGLGPKKAKPKKIKKLSRAEILKLAKERAKAEREARRAPPVKAKKPVKKKLVKKKPALKKPVRKKLPAVKKKPAARKPERRPVRKKLPERRPRRPSRLRAPKKPKPVSKQEKLRRRHESDLVLSYFRDVLHSTCGRMRDEKLVCTVRVHREGDASISGEIVVPVPPPGTKENDVRLLLITLEELDGWGSNPAPGKCWLTILFRVDARGSHDQKYPVKIAPGRATYNVGTNYHHLENSAYAFQIGRDEILPGLLEAGRAVIAIVMRVRYMPNGDHPTRPRV